MPERNCREQNDLPLLIHRLVYMHEHGMAFRQECGQTLGGFPVRNASHPKQFIEPRDVESGGIDAGLVTTA